MFSERSQTTGRMHTQRISKLRFNYSIASKVTLNIFKLRQVIEHVEGRSKRGLH